MRWRWHDCFDSLSAAADFLELTTGCDLCCIHCRASATELMSPEDLSHEESCAVIDQIAEYAPFILVLSGGEPGGGGTFSI